MRSLFYFLIFTFNIGVRAIINGGLTPVWAISRKATKPSDTFRPTHYHPFGEKSEESFMKSTLVNGGLHPYLYVQNPKN